MIRTFQRHPAISSIALGFLLLVAGSSVNASLGGVMVLVEGAIMLFFLVRWMRGRHAPSTFARAALALPLSSSLPVVAAIRHPIPPKLRFNILQRDNYTCRYCGAKGPEAGGTATLEIDHKLPVSLGGTNDPLNLVTSCRDCNRGKGAERIDPEDDPGRTLGAHQWETCRVAVQMLGDRNRQRIAVSATRYGAGKSFPVIKPKTFTFSVSLPPEAGRGLPSLDGYLLMVKDNERRSFETFLAEVDAKLTHDRWQRVSQREWRRLVA